MSGFQSKRMLTDRQPQDDNEKEIKELKKALRQCYDMLEVAFDYDADVFGIHHNDAIDASLDAERLLGIKS